MSRFNSTELAELRSVLLEERAKRAGSVVVGACKSFEAYNREVGYVLALDFAVDSINKILGSTGED